MSRSRRAPYVTGRCRNTRWVKRYAQHVWRRMVRAALRRGDDPPTRPEAAFNPWDICDYRWYCPNDPEVARK